MLGSWRVLPVVASLLGVACGSDDSGDDTMGDHTVGATSSAGTASTSAPMGSVSAGADIYTRYCDATACHGPDGDSGLGPRLSTSIPGQSDDALESIILLGIPGSGMSSGMPGQDLSAQDLADLMAYLRWTF